MKENKKMEQKFQSIQNFIDEQQYKRHRSENNSFLKQIEQMKMADSEQIDFKFQEEYHKIINFIKNHEEERGLCVSKIEYVWKLGCYTRNTLNNYLLKQNLALNYTKILNDARNHKKICQFFNKEIDQLTKKYHQYTPKKSNIQVLYLLWVKCLMDTNELQQAQKILNILKSIVDKFQIQRNLYYLKILFLRYKIFKMKNQKQQQFEQLQEAYEIIKSAKITSNFANTIIYNFQKLRDQRPLSHKQTRFQRPHSQKKYNIKSFNNNFFNNDHDKKSQTKINHKINQKIQLPQSFQKNPQRILKKPSQNNKMQTRSKIQKKSILNTLIKYQKKEKEKKVEQEIDMKQLINNNNNIQVYKKQQLSYKLLKRPNYKQGNRAIQAQKLSGSKSKRSLIHTTTYNYKQPHQQIQKDNEMVSKGQIHIPLIQEKSKNIIEENFNQVNDSRKTINMIQNQDNTFEELQKQRKSKFIIQENLQSNELISKLPTHPIQIKYLIYQKDRITHCLKDITITFIKVKQKILLKILLKSYNSKKFIVNSDLSLIENQFAIAFYQILQEMDTENKLEDKIIRLILLHLKHKYKEKIGWIFFLQQTELNSYQSQKYDKIRYYCLNKRKFANKFTLKELTKYTNYNNQILPIIQLPKAIKTKRICKYEQFQGNQNLFQLHNHKIVQIQTDQQFYINKQQIQFRIQDWKQIKQKNINKIKKTKKISAILIHKKNTIVHLIQYSQRKYKIFDIYFNRHIYMRNQEDFIRDILNKNLPQKIYQIEISQIQKNQDRIVFINNFEQYLQNGNFQLQLFLYSFQHDQAIYRFLKFSLVSQQKSKRCMFYQFFRKYFDINTISYLTNIKNLGPTLIVLTAYQTKQKYINDFILFKFEFTPQKSKTKMIKYICSKCDIETIINKKITNLEKDDLFEVIFSLSLLFTYKKDTIYYYLGLQSNDAKNKYIYYNKFSKSFSDNVSKQKQNFLSIRLNDHQIIWQKLIKFEICNNLLNGIITLEKFENSDEYLFFIYLPKNNKKFSIHIHKNFYKQQFDMNTLAFEVQNTKNNDNNNSVYLKFSNCPFFIKESNFSEFVEINEQIYHFQYRLDKKTQYQQSSLFIKSFKSISIKQAIDYKIYLRIYSLKLNMEVHLKFDFLCLAKQILGIPKRKINLHKELKYIQFNMADIILLFNQNHNKVIEALSQILRQKQFQKIIQNQRIINQLQQIIQQKSNIKLQDINHQKQFEIHKLKKISLNSQKKYQKYGYLKLIYKGIFVLKEKSICGIYHDIKTEKLIIIIQYKNKPQSYHQFDIQRLNIPFLSNKNQFIKICDNRIFKSLKNKLLLSLI